MDRGSEDRAIDPVTEKSTEQATGQARDRVTEKATGQVTGQVTERAGARGARSARDAARGAALARAAARARAAADKTPSLLRHLAAAVLLAALLLALTSAVNSFRDYQIAEIASDVVAVAGLSYLVGLSGQISLGHGAFVAVGAYVTALVMIHLHWPLVVVFIAAAAATAVLGAVLGIAAARLRGPYLAGATLLLAVALPSLADRFAGLLGGDQGLNVNITAPAGLGANFPLTRWQAWIACATALVTLVLLANLARSRVGRSWRAIRDDEVAAALAGLNVGRLRVLAFVVSAACAGLAGALLAITTGLVAPTAFTLALSIGLLTAAVLGGLGSLAGAVWGSIVLVALPVYATDVATSHGLSSSAGANVPLIAYGVALIAVMLAFPDGIQGGLRRIARLVTGSGRGATAVRLPAGARPGRPASQLPEQPAHHQEFAAGHSPEQQKEGPA